MQKAEELGLKGSIQSQSTRKFTNSREDRQDDLIVGGVQSQVFRYVGVGILKLGHEPGVAQVNTARGLLIAVCNLFQALHDMRVPNFDGKFPAAIETTGRQVNGTDYDTGAICVQQFGVQLQALELMHFDSDIVQDSRATHSLNQFLLFQLVWWPRQNVYVHPADSGPYQPLNDDGILIALILDPQGVCFASSINCPIRCRSLPTHQMRWEFSPGLKVCRCQSASKHAITSSPRADAT